MEVANIQQNNKQSKEDNKKLINIIRSTNIENLTMATREGLNNTNILESREMLENFVQERGKTLEKKLWLKHKAKNPPNNSTGSHKNNKQLKLSPVGYAKKQGFI